MMTGMNNPYMTEEDQQRMMAEMMRSKQKREQEAEMRRQQLQMQPQQSQEQEDFSLDPAALAKLAMAFKGGETVGGDAAIASGSMSGTGDAAMSSLVAPTSSVFTANAGTAPNSEYSRIKRKRAGY